MNTPDTDGVEDGKSRTKWVAAGVAIVAALSLLIGAMASGSGDDKPSTNATGEAEVTGDDVESADDPAPAEQPLDGQDAEGPAQEPAAVIDDAQQPEFEEDFDAGPLDDPMDLLPVADDVPSDLTDEPVGLGELCVDLRHQPVDEQNSASGIWVSGTVYGLAEGSWIWVEGPTINNGEPVQIPVEGNQFEGPLGINSYGDHEIEAFGLGGQNPADALYDAGDLLDAAFDGVIPVDAAEGSPFDTDCFQFDQPGVESSETSDSEAAEPSTPNVEPRGLLQDLLDEFVGAHVEGDADRLLGSLHPDVPLFFGEDTCDAYVRETTGSIVGAEILDVGEPRPHQLQTPNGLLQFDTAIPATLEFEVLDGSSLTSEANFPIDDSEAYWLTTCGVESP